MCIVWLVSRLGTMKNLTPSPIVSRAGERLLQIERVAAKIDKPVLYCLPILVNWNLGNYYLQQFIVIVLD